MSRPHRTRRRTDDEPRHSSARTEARSALQSHEPPALSRPPAPRTRRRPRDPSRYGTPTNTTPHPVRSTLRDETRAPPAQASAPRPHSHRSSERQARRAARRSPEKAAAPTLERAVLAFRREGLSGQDVGW